MTTTPWSPWSPWSPLKLLNSLDLVSKARPGASQPSGRRGSLDPEECGEYQRRSAEDLRKAILSPLLPSSQTGRQPDAVIRATLNHSALPGWCALRACARVVRVTVDAHITRTFKNFVYNEHWFQRLGLLLVSSWVLRFETRSLLPRGGRTATFLVFPWRSACAASCRARLTGTSFHTWHHGLRLAFCTETWQAVGSQGSWESPGRRVAGQSTRCRRLPR